MARLVLKFGGTSVADLDRIRNVAQHVKREYDAGNEIAVVVSAMSGKTNELVGWAKDASPMHDAREYDAVVSSGEQVTAGLLAIALQNIGIPARSWLGWQIPIHTDDTHGAARIKSIDSDNLNERFKEKQVAVIAGFQGISENGRITTLGRGGSDTSAVAIAAAIGADRCDIYTDVDGVYTTDPRIVKQASRMNKISYEEMLELASLGAKVLQTRSVEMAMNYNVPVMVRSSFDDPSKKLETGTLVCREENIVEQQIVAGIAYSKDESKISIRNVSDVPGIVAGIFGPLADANINVDMIVQNISTDGKFANVTFTTPTSDLPRALETLEAIKDSLGKPEIVSASNVTKISIVGVGMRSHAGVAAKMFKILSDRSINILAITTSEIKLSVLIDAEYTELALRALHSAYGLDAEEA